MSLTPRLLASVKQESSLGETWVQSPAILTGTIPEAQPVRTAHSCHASHHLFGDCRDNEKVLLPFSQPLIHWVDQTGPGTWPSLMIILKGQALIPEELFHYVSETASSFGNLSRDVKVKTLESRDASENGALYTVCGVLN